MFVTYMCCYDPRNSRFYVPSLTILLSMVYVIENINDLILAKNLLFVQQKRKLWIIGNRVS